MANKLIIEKKAQTVEEIASKIKDSAGVVFVDYRGLTDEEITSLRRSLRKNSADMKVYKNTLTKRALDSLNISMDECVLGPSALVYSTDAVAPIKTVTNFAKEHSALSVKGGIVDGKVSSLEELAQLATIPSKEVLIAKLLGSFKAPLSNLVYLLNAIKGKKESESAE